MGYVGGGAWGMWRVGHGVFGGWGMGYVKGGACGGWGMWRVWGRDHPLAGNWSCKWGNNNL